MNLINKKLQRHSKSLNCVFICVFAIIFIFSGNAIAQSGCVGWYSTNASGQLSYFNPVAASYTLLGTYTASTNINGAAVEPSTGNIYFVNKATSKLIVYDITTNTFTTRSGTLPNLGTIVGAAFSNSGTLYIMYDVFRMITVDPATGSQTGSTITYTGVPGDGASPAGTNGDIAFDSSGQMWMVGNNSSSTTRLYRVTISGTTATATASPASNISGLGTVSIVGLAIDSVTGTFYVLTSNGTYTLNTSTGAATLVSSSTGNDLASCAVAPALPTISKSFSPTSATSVPATSTLTITIPNTNFTENFLAANLVDTLPSGMTVASPNGLGGTCTTVSGNTITATAGSNTITFNSGGKIPVNGCTITVNTTVSSGGTYTNTIASGALKTLIGNNSSAASATFTVTTAPDLTLTKSDTGSFTVGSTGTYSFTATNSGASSTSGTITVTDTLPTGLTVNGGAAGGITEGGTNAANWTCNSNASSPQTITCTSSTAIAASGTSTFNFAVNVGLGTAVGTNSITNSASVSGGGETNTSNNSASDTTTVLSPNLTVAKSHTGNFTRGGIGNYTITVGNSGTASTSGTITVTDTLPTGLSVSAGTVSLSGANAANWSCSASGQVITCTSSTAIAASGSSVFSFNVNVASNAAASVTNSVAVSGGNEATANNGNNSATDPTTTVAPSDLTLAKSHTGNFTVGSTGAYSFTVTNSGTGASTGTITVTDTLPTGLTVNSGAAGSVTPGGTNAANWTCNSDAANPQTVTCTSSTVIAASGTSVFNFTVSVGLGTTVGTNSITNAASVSGGGEVNTSNNSASDPTTILSPNLTIAKSHTGNFTRGSTGTYTLTVGNSGTASTSGTITLTDTLPTGLSVNSGAAGSVTPGGTNAANWTCNSNAATPQVITCTSSTAIVTSGSSVFTLTVNVASNAASSVTNSVSVSGGGEATANNGNNSATDPTTINSAPPNVSLVKSCTVPANCTTAPQLPGTDLTYQISFTNAGGQAASGLKLVDGIPTNTDYKIGSASANVGSTGLTFTIEFSSDYDPLNPTLATWTYTPVSLGGGASTGYDRNVKAIRWRVTSGTLSNVSPNNTGNISFITKIR